MESSMQLYLLSIFLFIFSFHSAKAETIHVMGKDIQAKNLQYFAGTSILAGFDLLEPVEFMLPRGNSIMASDSVSLHKNGNISLLTSPGKLDLNWRLPSGVVLSLDCGKRAATPELPGGARVITFYENLEYKSGCALKNPTHFQLSEKNQITALDDIELDTKSMLQYSRKIVDGELFVGDRIVKLEPGTSVSFFEGGAPSFFSMKKGEIFKMVYPLMGEILFGQKENKIVSTTLTRNGSVERGVLAQEFRASAFSFLLPSGTGVAFSDDGFSIGGMIFEEPYLIKTGKYDLYVKSFVLDGDGSAVTFVTNSFLFAKPLNGELTEIPEGSEVRLAPGFEIVGIRVPLRR